MKYSKTKLAFESFTEMRINDDFYEEYGTYVIHCLQVLSVLEYLVRFWPI